MSPERSRELLQKPQITVEKQSEVFYSIAQHGQPLEAGAEREADVLLRVEAEIAHHFRVHLARAGNLQPSTLQRPALKLQVDLGRGLGEREERRPEAHLEIVDLEEAAQELGIDALQVGEAD